MVRNVRPRRFGSAGSQFAFVLRELLQTLQFVGQRAGWVLTDGGVMDSDMSEAMRFHIGYRRSRAPVRAQEHRGRRSRFAKRGARGEQHGQRACGNNWRNDSPDLHLAIMPLRMRTAIQMRPRGDGCATERVRGLQRL
jgi:hypothetical protein